MFLLLCCCCIVCIIFERVKKIYIYIYIYMYVCTYVFFAARSIAAYLPDNQQLGIVITSV